MEYSRIKDSLYHSNEIMRIPDRWEESVPFRCLIKDEEYDSFLYWATSGVQSKIKKMISINTVSGEIISMEPHELIKNFGLKTLVFDANVITDYDSYFDAKEKYEQFYITLCNDGENISNSINAYKLLILITGESFVHNILSVIAGDFVERILRV